MKSISRARRQANEVGDSEARGRRVHWMLRERVLEWGESGESVWREPEQATTNGEMWTLYCDDDNDGDDDESATQTVLPHCDRDTDPEEKVFILIMMAAAADDDDDGWLNGTESSFDRIII
ncbi:F-box domain protein [Aspergillus luchuensis]|uniref:F-box domain protein n=1 Tax=Aspergillus kawachii TaxID=1069201 RepID=A0A146FLJ2_ASPKA|nr:F-box domain protein [Aspergillus luchuensis]